MVALALLLIVAFEGLRAQRRAAFQLTTKYRLFALRDKLRNMAIETPALTEGWMFFFLDSTITRVIANLPGISVWRILALDAFCHNPDRELLRQRIEAELGKKGNEVFQPVMKDIAVELSKLLSERHAALFFAARMMRRMASTLEEIHSKFLRARLTAIIERYWVDQKRVQRVVFTSPETSTVCEYAGSAALARLAVERRARALV